MQSPDPYGSDGQHFIQNNNNFVLQQGYIQGNQMMQQPIASLPSQSPIARIQHEYDHESNLLTASGEMDIGLYKSNQEQQNNMLSNDTYQQEFE